MRLVLTFLVITFSTLFYAQNESQKVNVFLGTSGDHGQLSPAASYPFGILSIGPQTYPNLHAGYEYKAKKFLGFTHTRMEGVGCMGAGGNFLLKPFLDGNPDTELIKVSDAGSPGFYGVHFENGIEVKTAVAANQGQYVINFPKKRKAGLILDLGYAFLDRFVGAEFAVNGNEVLGFADTKSTCNQGKYRVYFYFKFPEGSQILTLGKNKLEIKLIGDEAQVDVGLSSVGASYAKSKIEKGSFESLKTKSEAKWSELLGRVKVKGRKQNEDLFYSLLYRTLQSPFMISEEDGSYRATDGSLQKSLRTMYHGWAVWDNYRDQFPLFSLIYPEIYKDMTYSLLDMYRYEKTQWASDKAPSLTVRTEHTVGVLLDAVKKGVELPISDIVTSIKADVDSWKLDSPDKILEASYDYWAASELFAIVGKSDWTNDYLEKAKAYKDAWRSNFKDVESKDADKMGARGVYQGTIWQYRWLVAQDLRGLKDLVGGESQFRLELDQFFNEDFYNHANETDTQVPHYYNVTKEPWKSQSLIRKLLVGEVNHFYFNDNSKGISPYIGRIYKNAPEAFLRTMDDDAGAMSSWWVLHSLGYSPANVGDPVFYLNAPLFSEYTIEYPSGRKLVVQSPSAEKNFYINEVEIDGKISDKNWINYFDFQSVKNIKFQLVPSPNKNFGVNGQFETGL